jgi:hypothetical protein
MVSLNSVATERVDSGENVFGFVRQRQERIEFRKQGSVFSRGGTGRLAACWMAADLEEVP